MASKRAKPKKPAYPLPRLEYDEDCGNVYIVYKKIDGSDNIVEGEAFIEIDEEQSLEWATKLAKQMGLPLFAEIKTKTQVV